MSSPQSSPSQSNAISTHYGAATRTNTTNDNGSDNNNNSSNDCINVNNNNNNNNAPITPTPPTTPLTKEQNDQLIRLWHANCRILVDVKISSQEDTTTKRNREPPFSTDTYSYMVRMYHYFYKYLELNCSNPLQQQQQNSTDTIDINNSCLRSYAQLALMNTSSNKTTSGGERNNHTNSNTNRNSIQKLVQLIEGRHVITLHHEDFMNEFNHFELNGLPISDEYIRKHSYGSFLYFMPHLALPAIGCAMALSIISLFEKQQIQQLQQSASTNSTNNNGGNIVSHWKNSIERYIDNVQIMVRFAHVYPQVQMMDIKTGLVGKFVSIKGHVVKVRPKRLRLATGDFICQNCGSTISHTFDNGQYTIPTKCISTSSTITNTSTSNDDIVNSDSNAQNSTTTTSNNNCRSKSFTFVRPTARYINVQEIRIQEVQEETIEAGRTPKQIEIDLSHDLVNACRPGDIVLIAATVAAVNTAVASGVKGKRAVQETSTYKLYLIGHSVTSMSETNSNKGQSNTNTNRRKSSSCQQFTYTQHQLRNIVQLCHADHKYFSLIERRAFPFDLLVRSLCPSIIGHHEVKAGLMLCLLGGTPSSSSLLNICDKGNSIRSNSHILIVGDPGMGKSQMLLAATSLAARSVYVGGNTSSTTGLTVSLTKEEKGEAGIEAGALVLADQGICAIDEFDKMAKNHQDGLLEAMEQQQVSIAKAGVVASLPARCSVIAAANPKHGSYDMSRTVAENLNMAKPILSRFDLVFILRDRADKVHDRLVSSNIMNLYRPASSMASERSYPVGNADKNPNGLFGNGGGDSSASIFAPPTGNEMRMPLSERLAWVADIQKNPLPADLVRDYIAYAREYCKPQMTQEAGIVLKEYYMELRYPSDGKRKRDTVPITTRQLEALIRLCQARAKAALRDYVLKEDALDVIELMTISVKDVHCDEEGRVDPCRGGAGGTSNRKMKKAFLNELHRVVGVGAECSLDDMRRIADKVGCGLNDFQSMIEGMRDNGLIMLKADGRYKILS